MITLKRFRRIEAILRAQGYQTLQSPAGPDGGVDILAAPGDMGVGQPRLCVQVKSGVQVCGSPILRDLIGTMQTHRAENGLLVSWSSWTKDADRLLKSHFFTVRAWDRNILIEELLKVYDRLDIIIRSELPLRQVWIPVTEDNS